MRELLKRWHAREPSRCLIGPPVSHIGVGFKLAEDTHFVLFDNPLPHQLALLLAAVIEAIEARGGSWELRGSGCPASARVTLNGAARGCVADEPTDPPAFPLLAAYLRALEAEAQDAAQRTRPRHKEVSW